MSDRASSISSSSWNTKNRDANAMEKRAIRKKTIVTGTESDSVSESAPKQRAKSTSLKLSETLFDFKRPKDKTFEQSVEQNVISEPETASVKDIVASIERREIERLQHEIIGKSAELKKKDQENADLLQRYNAQSMMSQRMAGKEEENVRLRAQLKEKDAQIMDLFAQCDEKFMAENSSNDADKDEIARLKREILLKQQQEIAIRISVDQNAHLLEERDSEIAEKNALLQKCAMQIANKNAFLKKYAMQLDELTAKNKDHNGLQQKLNEKEAEIEGLKTELKDTYAQNMDLMSQCAESERLKKQQINRETSMKRKTSKKWVKTQAPNDDYSKRLADINRREREVIIGLKREVDVLTEEVAGKGRRISEYEAIVSSLKKRLGDAQKKIDELEGSGTGVINNLINELDEKDVRLVELGAEIADLNKRLRASEEISVELLKKQNKKGLFNQTHKDLINGKTKKRLFKPRTLKWIKPDSLKWMLVVIVTLAALIISSVWIWYDYLFEEKKKATFSPFHGGFDSEYALFWPSDLSHKNLFYRSSESGFSNHISSVIEVLFSAFVGYFLLRVLKSWTINDPHLKVEKVEHKKWKRSPKDHRLISV